MFETKCPMAKICKEYKKEAPACNEDYIESYCGILRDRKERMMNHGRKKV